VSVFVPNRGDTARAFSDAQVEQFIQDGFVRIEPAFAREVADGICSALG
jgi:hypothetical protein